MTTAEMVQNASNVRAAAPSKTTSGSSRAAAFEAVASSSALFAEHAASEWKLLFTALTVVGEEDDAAGAPSSGDSDGQPSPSAAAAVATAPSFSFPSLASAAARGDYSLAFATPEARRILSVQDGDEGKEDEDEAARRYWSSVADACRSSPSSSPPSSPTSASSAPLERLALGASALLAFVQAAFTGPELELGTPRELAEGGGKQHSSSPVPPSLPPPPLPPGGLPLSALDAAALETSGANGESVDSRVKGAQFLAVAVAALLGPLQGLSDGSNAAASGGGAKASGGSPSPTSLPSALSRLPPTWSLWALRAACARQRVLGAPAAATRDALDVLAPFAAAAIELGSSASSSRYSGSSSPPPPLSPAQARLAMAGCALEAAACRLELRESGSGSSDASPAHAFAGAAFLREAAEALGVSVSVTGALGVRTIHQEEARAQLVVRISRLKKNGREGSEEEAEEREESDFVALAGGDDVSALFSLDEGSPSAASASAASADPSKEGDRLPSRGGLTGLAAERSEVLTAPRLGGGGRGQEGSNNDAADENNSSSLLAAAAAAAAPLTPPVQALLLLRASAVRRGTADDGLRAWRAAPFVEALSSPQQKHSAEEEEEGNAASSSSSLLPLSCSRWAVAACAALARSRHELCRPRTRERALLAFERLASAQGERVDKKPSSSSSASSVSASSSLARRRVPLALATPLPPSHRARKEAADSMLSAGLVSEALDVYEKVEAWEASALCHRLLGHAEQARATLEARVEAASKNSKKNASALLLPALLCSLGDVTGDASRYEEAWERSRGRCARAQRALARCASTRQDWRKAAAAWDLALSLNPIHGEGWFARGYCALKLGDDASAALAFSRAATEEPENGEAWNNLAAVHLRAERWRPAFSALSQAVKVKKNSWQTWHNYAQAALAVGEGSSAARGVAAVVELTDGRGAAADGGLLLLDLSRFAADASSAARQKKRQEPEEEEEEEREQGQSAPEAAETEEAGANLSQLTLDDGGGDFDDTADEVENDTADERPAPLSSRGLSSLRSAVGRALRLAAASAACSSQASTWHALAIFHDSEPAAAAAGAAAAAFDPSFSSPGEGGCAVGGVCNGINREQQQRQHLAGSRAAAREARLKRVAALSGGTAWRNEAQKFDEFASAASDLGRAEAKAAAEKRMAKEEDDKGATAAALAVAGGGQRELASARMLLKGVVATGKDRFAEAPAFAEAVEALAEVEKELISLVESMKRL